MEGIARQPEAQVTAYEHDYCSCLVEGVALIAIVVCLLTLFL